MKEKPRCFVISPTGDEGSAVREHADNVSDYIITPAMDECGVDAQRADQRNESGRITDQMFAWILETDFCIALLTGCNPNVMYEVAVAQVAAKPVVFLMLKDQRLPIDLKDLRCVNYDFSPRPLQQEQYKKQLIK